MIISFGYEILITTLKYFNYKNTFSVSLHYYESLNIFFINDYNFFYKIPVHIH